MEWNRNCKYPNQHIKTFPAKNVVRTTTMFSGLKEVEYLANPNSKVIKKIAENEIRISSTNKYAQSHFFTLCYFSQRVSNTKCHGINNVQMKKNITKSNNVI